MGVLQSKGLRVSIEYMLRDSGKNLPLRINKIKWPSRHPGAQRQKHKTSTQKGIADCPWPKRISGFAGRYYKSVIDWNSWITES